MESQMSMSVIRANIKNLSVDYKFSKPFKSYLVEDAVYNFINSVIEENKYYSEVLKKTFK